MIKRKKIKRLFFILLFAYIININFIFANTLGQIEYTQIGYTQTELSNPIPSTSSTIITKTDSSEKARLWSEKKLCRFIKGCLENNFCYPFGYIKQGQYCGTYYIASFERRGFINQSEDGENCMYNFQCKSNFCFNQKCIGSIDSLIINMNNKINNLELTIKTLKEEKQNRSLKGNYLNESLKIKPKKTIDTKRKTRLLKGWWNNLFGEG